jgi:DHA2 family multidrug resistance protein-like MFS transporter
VTTRSRMRARAFEGRLRRHRWAVMVPLLMAVLTGALAVSMLATALPRLADDLRLPAEARAWVMNVYPLTMAAAIVGAARWGDGIGRRRALAAGLLLFAALSTIAPLSPNGWVLIAIRAGLGVGGAVIVANVVGTVGAVFAGRDLAIANGLWVAVFGAASAFGPMLGGLLTDRLGWAWVFWLCVPVAGAGAVLTGWLVPDTRVDRAGGLDPLSNLGCALGLGAVVFGVQKASTAPVTATVTVAVGAGILVLFVRRQLRIPQPLLDVRLFSVPAFAGGFIAILGAAALSNATTYLVSIHLQQDLGLTALAAGAVLLWQAAAITGAGLIAPRVPSGWVRRVAPAGLVLQAVGLTMLGLTARPPAVALIMVGAGVGFVGTVCTTRLFANAPKEAAAQVGAIQEIGFALGGGIGIAVFDTVFRAGAPSGFRTATLAAAVTAVVVAALAARGDRR